MSISVYEEVRSKLDQGNTVDVVRLILCHIQVGA